MHRLQNPRVLRIKTQAAGLDVGGPFAEPFLCCIRFLVGRHDVESARSFPHTGMDHVRHHGF